MVGCIILELVNRTKNMIISIVGRMPMKGLYGLFEWVARMAYVNVLWILFSILGAGVLGVGPATLSAFTVIRKRLREGEGFSTWQVFAKTYRDEFWKGNKLTLLLFPIYLFIYIDFSIIQTLPYHVFIDYIVFPALLLLSVLVVILSSYLFAVHAHFDLPFWKYITYAVLAAGISPLSVVLIIFGLALISLLSFLFPATLLFFGVSIPVLLIQACALQAFGKMETFQLHQKRVKHQAR